MELNEREVYISRDGEGRAAIIERSDNLFCIYVHWIWPETGGRKTWVGDSTPLDILYEDKQPSQGIYGTVENARKEVWALLGSGGPPILASPPSGIPGPVRGTFPGKS